MAYNLSGTQAPSVSLIHYSKSRAFYSGTSILQEEEDMKKSGLLSLRKLPSSLPGHFCFPLIDQYFYMDVEDPSNTYLIGPHWECASSAQHGPGMQ